MTQLIIQFSSVQSLSHVQLFATLELIKSALGEAIRNKVRSIRYVDKVLLNYRQQEEIRNEGNTTISDKWRKDIDETMSIAQTRWVKEDD